MDGQWSEAAGSLWPRELIESVTADFHVPALSELRGPALAIIGLDWGVSYDRTAAAVLYRLPIAALNPDRDWLPTFVVLPYIWAQKTPLHQCVLEVVASPALWRYVSTETNGAGAGPSQELERKLTQRRTTRPDDVRRNWNKLHTTAATKTAGHMTALGLAERGQLVLPRSPDLLRQLAGLKFEQGQRGFLSIEAENAATHDDAADAIMASALPYRRSGGSVVCHLLRLADPESAAVDAQVPDLDCEVVETGAGLRVYKHPPFQSVGGAEVTLPDVPQLQRRTSVAFGNYTLTTGGRTAS